MTTYIVAGTSTNKSLTKCEMMGEALMAGMRDVKVFKVAYHPSEWNDFLNSVCYNFGFYLQSDPIIFTVEGMLVGNENDFQQLIENQYKIIYNDNLDSIEKRTSEMANESELLHKRKIEGIELDEKIAVFLEDAVKKGMQKFPEKSFIVEVQNSIKFFKRKGKYPSEEFNIIPEKPKPIISEKYKNFFDFKEKYEKCMNLIQEEIKAQAEKRRQEAIEEELRQKAEEERLLKQQELEENQEIEKKEAEEKNKQSDILNNEASQNPQSQDSQENNKNLAEKKEAPVQVEYVLSEELPISYNEPVINTMCNQDHLILEENSKFLLLNPIGKYAGEMIYVNAKKNGKNQFEIKDFAATYGRTNRLLEKDFGKGLNSYNIDIISPLRANEWFDLLKLMHKLHAIVYWYFLPINEVATLLSAQIIHLLKVPCPSFNHLTENLPILPIIQSYVEKLKNKEIGEVFELKEFNFPHKVFAVDHLLKAEEAENGYLKII